MAAKTFSFDEALRNTVREELAAELVPMKNLLEELSANAAQLEALTALASKLAPLFGAGALPVLANRVAPARRGPGRPRKAANVMTPASGGRRGPKPVNTEACAIKGCSKPSRSKGYCSAHYQKMRNLAASNRLPATWTDFPGAGTVEDVKLPRGGAASKAKAEATATQG